MEQGKQRAASPLVFDPEALTVVREGSNETIKIGVGTLPDSGSGSSGAGVGSSGANSPMKGAHISAIPPWTGCAISRVNGAADQMSPGGTSRSKPNAAWSVHAGDAFAFLAPASSALDGMARRDGKRPKRNVSFTEGAPESCVIPSVLCQTPRRLRTTGSRALPDGATDEATWLLYSGDGGLGFELDEQGVVLSVASSAAPFSVTPPFRTSPQAERRGGGTRGDGSLLAGDRVLAVNGIEVVGRAAVLNALPKSRAFVHFDVARADVAGLSPPERDGPEVRSSGPPSTYGSPSSSRESSMHGGSRPLVDTRPGLSSGGGHAHAHMPHASLGAGSRLPKAGRVPRPIPKGMGRHCRAAALCDKDRARKTAAP